MSSVLGGRPQPSGEMLASALERSSHPFLMWEGVASVPATLRGTLRPERRGEVGRAAEALDGVQAVHLIGCGTSYFSAIAATYALPKIAGVPASAHDAFEFAAYPPAALDRAGLVAISHTGGTESVISALATARQRGAVTIGLTDVPWSPVAEAATVTILGEGGREPALPKTRSYVASLLRHYLLAAAMAARRERNADAYRRALETSPETARQVLDESAAQMQRLGAAAREWPRMFVIGAGPNLATAHEGALKLRETAHVPAHAWELEEAMHGPWVSIDPGDLVIVLAFQGPAFSKAAGFAAALAQIDARVWIITDAANSLPRATHVTRLGVAVPECLTPLYAVLPLYQFAYHVALARGVRPDAMRLDDQRYLAARMALPR
ncbi:MAG TPA: SIS domain-containing protein [bacterium]|nr:SIS domain-containing protein [bacterium]